MQFWFELLLSTAKSLFWKFTNHKEMYPFLLKGSVAFPDIYRVGRHLLVNSIKLLRCSLRLEVAFEMKIGAFHENWQRIQRTDVDHKSCKSPAICSNSRKFTTDALFILKIHQIGIEMKIINLRICCRLDFYEEKKYKKINWIKKQISSFKLVHGFYVGS